MTAMKATGGHTKEREVQERFHQLANWAENEMELKPDSTTALRGADAAAHARAMFEAAGVDAGELARLIGGRPSLDPNAAPGAHSPKLNVRVPEPVSEALAAQARTLGLTTSALARRILTEWLNSRPQETNRIA
ncbi:hypothetical protein [Arthrobacter roseus]|uniref:hypothetical protein n=1 Tax=Arthrobacter roseus TaxID=136274 RepID=UPI0019669545|nr:hypothetical protein [Arthrobacter roseus]MBM7848685.1 hypothetical protein [Arthrobacter roseus]